MDSSASLARGLLGIRVAPHFDEPYLSTSFKDWWSRRWNLTVGNCLRFLIYDPIIEGSSSVVPQYCLIPHKVAISWRWLRLPVSLNPLHADWTWASFLHMYKMHCMEVTEYGLATVMPRREAAWISMPPLPVLACGHASIWFWLQGSWCGILRKRPSLGLARPGGYLACRQPSL